MAAVDTVAATVVEIVQQVVADISHAKEEATTKSRLSSQTN
jgi:hypothetical protein